MRISDWSSDVCSSDLPPRRPRVRTSLCRTCRLNPPAQASTGDVPSALRRLVAAHLVGRRVAVPFERARPARALALVVAIVLEAGLEALHALGDIAHDARQLSGPEEDEHDQQDDEDLPDADTHTGDSQDRPAVDPPAGSADRKNAFTPQRGRQSTRKYGDSGREYEGLFRRSEEHTVESQSRKRITNDVIFVNKKRTNTQH